MDKKNPNNSKKAALSMSTLYKQWYFILTLSLLITVLVILLKQIPFFHDMEFRALDYRFRTYPLRERVDDVVIVAIDQSSLQEFVANGHSWPWPREFYGAVLNYFSSAGAKGVIFDILFYEPDHLSSVNDEIFAESMYEYNKTILAALMVPDAMDIPRQLSQFSLDIDEEISDSSPRAEGISAPIELFLENAASVATVNVMPDSDGVIRRTPLFFRIGEYVIPQLSMGALFLPGSGYSTGLLTKEKNKWFFDDIRVPIDKKGNYLINWYGSEGPDGVFQYYPFRSVVQSYIQQLRGEAETVLPPELFKDKYVIIGATAPGLYDLKTTPVSQVHPGLEIWGTILSNFINKDFIRTTPNLLLFIYLALISLLLMFIFVHNPLKIGNILLVLLFITIIILPLMLWANYRIHLNIVSPVVLFVLSFMSVTFISYISEGKSKKEIKKAFSRYLHPQIIEQLMNNPDLVDLEGKEFEATMIFSDIYNFTNFSEKTDPKTLITLLNKYFETLTGTILDNDGMLDKFMGDGLMAVFGAPLQSQKHPFNACKAALTHKKTWLQYANGRDIDDFSVMFHVNTRIGINTGPVVAGNMGSVRRVDYTVIGDAVNLAARLESINKFYKTDIIISEHTHDFVKDSFICRELDSMKVKGKDDPTKIFELIDFKDSAEKSYTWIDDYVEALNLYRTGDWDKAISLFRKLAESDVKDKVAKIMLDRCTELKEINPKDWDGIYKWEVK